MLLRTLAPTPSDCSRLSTDRVTFLEDAISKSKESVPTLSGRGATEEQNHKADTSKDYEIKEIKFRPAQNINGYNILTA